ncbi:MAG: NUDIX domain-containing protein [Candidatus Aenigmarchaeota archaeon]|nr:NUDIX domain-containing protein [Candidatus Aenigmarchaeota archaeon]
MKTDLTVAGFLFHKNKVLLIHHRKLNLWLPPGGHIGKNETPDEALERELKEELGLEIEILNRKTVPMGGNIKKQLAVPFYVNVHSVGGHDHCCFFYVCKSKNPEKLKINENELKNFAWFSIGGLNAESIPEDVRSIAIEAFKAFNAERASK